MRNWQEPSPSSRLPSVSILDPPSLHFHNVISQNCSAAAQCPPPPPFVLLFCLVCVFVLFPSVPLCGVYINSLSLFYRFNEALVTCFAYGCSPYAIKHVTDAALLLLLSTVVLFFSLIKDRRGTHTEKERERES